MYRLAVVALTASDPGAAVQWATFTVIVWLSVTGAAYLTGGMSRFELPPTVSSDLPQHLMRVVEDSLR